MWGKNKNRWRTLFQAAFSFGPIIRVIIGRLYYPDVRIHDELLAITGTIR